MISMTRARNLTQSSQQDCCCKLLCQNLKPGDSFRRSNCNKDIQGVSNGTSDEEEEANAEGAESSRRKVQEIFARIAGRSQRQSVSKEGNPLLTAAREEALSSFSDSSKATGYQKLACGPSPFVVLKGDAKALRHLLSPPNHNHHIHRCPVPLFVKLVLGSKDLMKMKNRGCYSDDGFSLNSSWTKAKVEAEVQRWFSGAWTFIRTHGLHEQVDKSGDMLSWFQLLTRNNHVLSVVESRFPTGRDLY
ncbi:hypothetical protein F5I97DRAFT_1829014 [Phlebopus sp. FC_14]|nr:hypothetical protein F5I97DRAFT_1829014 [Phlebopus sp. FC_14]